ncbi:MAG: HNH endonuclease [Maritimibacter sp.]|nr:HNH endonuclease [Maritimibacter sp.]
MGVRRDHHRHSKRITRTKRWKALRMEILERDSFRCRSCGTGGRLEVDHIKPVRTHPDLAYAAGNLQALCPACHTRKTRLECGHPPPREDRQDWRQAVAALERPDTKPIEQKG